MMNRLGWSALMMLAMVGCTEPAVTADLGGARSASTDEEPETKTKTKAAKPKADANDDDASDSLPTPAASEKSAEEAPAEEPKDLAIDAMFGAGAGVKFGNIAIHRSCSDMGVDFNQASLVDGTSLMLVDVYTKKVLVTVQGAELQAIKDEMTKGKGNLHIPVDAAALPTKSTEYAIVMGGDGRFGSVAKCGADIAPHDDQDRGVKGGAGRFPTGADIVFDRRIGGDGCGIIGFLQAYYDAATGEVYARASSPIIIAADDEGRAGFPPGKQFPGCDAHASPLVLDLAGGGVTLSKARADVFDIDGNGRRDAMSWVSSSDTPFLVRDANGNGLVDGASELFGNLGAANGFEALAKIDNGDGVIDDSDKAWSTLRLWFDRNHDGRTDAGELETLEARGVKSIATSYISQSERLVSGGEFTGEIRQRGAVTMTDGRSLPVLDVWFERQF